MADQRMSVVTPTEVSTLKEALFAQQELLQKLHNDLEAEREASATAASEALSVILRLQEEKATVKLEAEHYKRLAEEKMCHAEESFAVIEDVINEREMEVADLEYKLECYRYKLLRMGCVDPGDGDLIYPEHLLQGNLGGNLKIGRLGRRNSEPVLVTFMPGEPGSEGSKPDVGCSSKSLEKQTVQDSNDTILDSEKKTREGVITYGEQIKELNQKVKGILECNQTNVQNETRCPLPRIRVGDRKNTNKAASLGETQQKKHSTDIRNKDETVDHSCSPSVLDVFEVPRADSDCGPSGSSSNSLEKKDKQAKQIDESKDFIHPKGLKPYSKNENDWPQKHTCQTDDICPADPVGAHPLQCAAESSHTSNHFNQISAIDELARLADFAKQEELKLLKEIHEKLNLLHEEIRYQRVKKSPRCDYPSLPLPEAMLYFWL